MFLGLAAIATSANADDSTYSVAPVWGAVSEGMNLSGGQFPRGGMSGQIANQGHVQGYLFVSVQGPPFSRFDAYGKNSPSHWGPCYGNGIVWNITGEYDNVMPYRGFLYGLPGFSPIAVGVRRNQTDPWTNYEAHYDGRSEAQIADAPKISIGAPGGEDGFMKFGLFGNGLRIAAAGRISDPGHPINPNGLELQADENGVRRTVNVPVGPDGSFHIDGLVAWGPNGPSGRPLFLYHRTAGDEVNVGYFGNGTEVSRKKELKTFQYDELRNKISEAVKAEPGRFRHIRTNGVTMGVRG